MGKCLSLGLARVFEQGAAGADRGLELLAAVAGEARRSELLQQDLAPCVEFEMPLGEPGQRVAGESGVLRRALRKENFRGTDAAQLGREDLRGDLGDAQIAARQIEPGQADRAFRAGKREQEVVGLLLEQRRVGERARRDDARDLPVDRALRSRRIADLLADRYRLADAHQLGEILVDRVIRHAGHPDRRARRGAARGEGDVEQARGALRILVEQLVEIAHAVEEQHVGMLRLDAQVLLHHGGVRRDGIGGGGRFGFHRPYSSVVNQKLLRTDLSACDNSVASTTTPIRPSRRSLSRPWPILRLPCGGNRRTGLPSLRPVLRPPSEIGRGRQVWRGSAGSRRSASQ